MKRFILPLAAIIVFSSALVALATSHSPVMGDGAKLATSSCNRCHNLERVCRNLGVKDQMAWQKTVERMIRKGAPLTELQGRELSVYLSRLAPGSDPICN
jgi:hypothetical protein